jgi:small-conductance mechanosensitive channel
MELIEFIKSQWDVHPDVTQKIVYSLLIMLLLLLLRFFALRVAYRSIDSEKVKGRYLWKRWIKNSYYLLFIIIVGFIWVDKIDSFATFLGLFSAGLAIALQDPLVNFVGWMFILIRKPFELGDRIQIGDHAGDVIDVRFFQFNDDAYLLHGCIMRLHRKLETTEICTTN